MSVLPTFPLFPDPVRERVFKKSRDACGICGQSRGVLYDGPGAHLPHERVCPWCIADGSAERRGIMFNDASTQSNNPATITMTAADAELVEHRTPGFVTWQGNHWTACCGRACIYLGEADAKDLQGRWAQAVPSMYADLDWPADKIAEHVASFERESSPSAFVFKCQVCGKLQGYWDCD